MSSDLVQPPGNPPRTFLDFPLAGDLENLAGDLAILGIPFGKPYLAAAMANDQSRAPDALRRAGVDTGYTRGHYDFDLGGPLLDGRTVRVVDCGNVTADRADHDAHYRRAEQAAREIFGAGATLVSLGGDHGVSIPVLRALEAFGRTVTLVHVDAHLDWREDINGEREGYSSPIRRAAEISGPSSRSDYAVSAAPGSRRYAGNLTLVYAERLICNFIGAAVRAGYFDSRQDY